MPITGPRIAGEETAGSMPAAGKALASWWRRIDLGLLGVLGLPWIVARLDTSWLFAYATTTAGYIDAWVYFGFFLDLTQHIKTFKGAYFTTRLAWTVPGAIAYRLFPPLMATYVLHMAVFYAAIVSLYLVLKITVGRRGAFLAVVLMAFHSYFLWSVGWPYIDGAGNAYLLMTMAALTYAARRERNTGSLLGAGALAAMTVYCQLFLIVLSPVVFAYYYFARKRSGYARARAEWKPFGWGFVLVTTGFGIFNMAVNGRFFFFANAMGTAAKLMVRHNPYVDTTYGWMGRSPWVVLPLSVLVGAILFLRRRTAAEVPGRDFILFWLRFYVVAAGILGLFQVIGQPILQQVGYASYLLPGVFLALGAIFGIATHRLSRVQFGVVCGAVLGLSVLPLIASVNSSAMIFLQQHTAVLPLALGTAGLAGIAGVRSRIMAAAAVVVFAGGVAALNAGTTTRMLEHGDLPNDGASQKAAMLAIANSARTVKSLDPQGNLYFWYDVDAQFGMIYRAVASTYLWAYRLEGEHFPQLGAKLPPAGRRIVILAEDGERALAAGQAALARTGLRARLVATRTIREGPFTWEMVEVEIVEAAR